MFCDKSVAVLGDITPLILRVLFGSLFAMSGYAKLTSFGATAHAFGSMGLPAPYFMAGLAGGVEFAGGVLLVIGLWTRLAAALLAFTMIVAYATAHRDSLTDVKSFMKAAPFAYLMAMGVVLTHGAGRVALQRLVCKCKDRCKVQKKAKS